MKALQTTLVIMISACVLMACNAKQQSDSVELPFKACKLNDDIPRKEIPHTPENMSLPEFGSGVIEWGTGPEDAKQRLESIQKFDLKEIQEKGTTLVMVEEWQAFYENEVQRNPCNPAASYRAQLMKKIAQLWGEEIE